MMRCEMMTEPSGIWKEYQDGVHYKSNIDLYETVKANENYYNDKQWEGLNAPDLDKPTLNFIRPVVNYYVALMISDDIAVNVTIGGGVDDAEKSLYPKVISAAVDDVLEYTNIRYHNRRALRNAALNGDACMHFYFDTAAESGEAVSGMIKLDVLDNTNVYFGDTSSPDVQGQPYIIIAYRRLIDMVRRAAKQNGEDPTAITADSDDSLYMNSENDVNSRYVTVLRKLWRDEETGTIWAAETTCTGYVKKPFDLGYKRYPVAWMSWEDVKNSYHGVSPVTGKIANQQYINKMYAMAMQYCKMYAFPKVIYDSSKLRDGWNNQIGRAIAVNGDPRESVLIDSVGAGQFNSQAIDLANQTITQTKELMGASDAALGNVRPDNTSAIIAVQKAANAPLDIQRLIFYNFVEECIRNIIDMMRVNYGSRSYSVTGDDGNEIAGTFDYSQLDELHMRLKVDIGQGSYWSELMQIQTLDAMMMQKIIPDAVTYLECMPDGYVKNKQKLIDKWKELQEQALPPEMAAPSEVPPEAEAVAETEPFSADIPDDDMAELCAEISRLPDEKREQVIDKLVVSEETKAVIRQMIEGGVKNDMPEMQM